MPSVQEWRGELLEIADRLEAGAAQWALAKDARDELDEISDRVGALRADAPWAAIPHAEVVVNVVVPQLRKLAADMANLPDPPVGDDG